MEEGDSSHLNGESSMSIPRGGPIFVQDFVSPPTRASVFESDVFHELESLKAELGSEPADLEEEDISVDDLKIYSDEELVAEAMKIAFEDKLEARTISDVVGEPSSSGAEDHQKKLDTDTLASCDSLNSSDSSYKGEKDDAKLKKRKRNTKRKGKSKNGRIRKSDADTSASCDSLNSSDSSYNGEKDDAKLQKRKRNTKRKGKLKNGKIGKLADRKKDKHIDDSYLAKVEHLARTRQKQEEDKASVNLHSLNREKDNTAALSSGNIETLKYLESCSFPSKMKYSLSGKPGPIHYPEVILCVEVYHNKYPSKKTQEFLVLGSQFLTELRDKIRCLTDMVMRKGDAYDPSGYFLIEEVFCNDTRDPSSVDYSEPILDWLKNSKEEALAKWNSILSGVGKGRKVPLGSKPVSKLPNFRSVDMQKTRFCDLGFRLGTGYLYCHQGDCKHVIVIRDMRLIHTDDVQNRAAYPLLVYQPKAILKKCSVCRIYKATKVTLDDKLAGKNPCYFCDNCYYLLHYSEEGTLLYSTFTVHDYLQDYY